MQYLVRNNSSLWHSQLKTPAKLEIFFFSPDLIHSASQPEISISDTQRRRLRRITVCSTKCFRSVFFSFFVHMRNIEWLITLFQVLKMCFKIFVCMAFISSLTTLNLLHEWLHNKHLVRTLCVFLCLLDVGVGSREVLLWRSLTLIDEVLEIPVHFN